MDLPQPLEPRVVDDLLLGDLALRQPHGRGKGNVAVDRVVAEALALEVSHGNDLTSAALPLSSPTIASPPVDGRFRPRYAGEYTKM